MAMSDSQDLVSVERRIVIVGDPSLIFDLARIDGDGAALSAEVDKIDNTESENKERSKRLMKMLIQKHKVIEELIATEQKYIEDLELCMKIFLARESRPSVDVSILFGNMHEVVSISRQLLTKLENMERIVNERCFGKCFLEMSDALKTAYAPYCRNQDDVYATMEKMGRSEDFSQWMELGVAKMREVTNVIDLKSIMIKPVQRILKYPLLLQEMSKNTCETDPSKFILAEAIQVMNKVAQEINEIKRRRDVVLRYSQDQDSSITDRISRINLRSVQKRTIRFSEQIYQGLGVSEPTLDTDFDKAEQSYMEICQTVDSFEFDMASANDLLLDFCSSLFAGIENLSGLFDRSREKQVANNLLRTMTDIKLLVEQYNSVIKYLLKALNDLKNFLASPQKLMEKRYDKLLDCDHLRHKIDSLESQGNALAEPVKIKDLQKSLSEVTKIYDPLNSQLKEELPQLCIAARTILNNCLACYISSQRSLFQHSYDHLIEIASQSQIGAACLSTQTNGVTSYSVVVERFLSRSQFTVEELQHKVSFFPSDSPSVTSLAQPDSATCAINENALNESKFPICSVRPLTLKIAPRNTKSWCLGESSPGALVNKVATKSLSSSPSTPRTPNYTNHNRGKQSDQARVYLKSRYPQDKLCYVMLDYMAKETVEVSVASQTLVGVIKDRDPLGTTDRWLIDTGEVKGFLPADVLCQVQPVQQQSWSQSWAQQSLGDWASGQYQNPCDGKSPEILVEGDKPTASYFRYLYRVLYKFAGVGSNTISVEKDEVVELLKDHDQEGNKKWWLVKSRQTGLEGFVPANYLRFLKTK